MFTKDWGTVMSNSCEFVVLNEQKVVAAFNGKYGICKNFMLKTLFLDLKIYEYCCTWFLQQSSFNCHLKTLVTWMRDAPGNTLLKWFSLSEQIMPLSFVQQTCTMQCIKYTASRPELHRRNSSLSPTESKVFTVQCFPRVQLYILICT